MVLMWLPFASDINNCYSSLFVKTILSARDDYVSNEWYEAEARFSSIVTSGHVRQITGVS